MTVWIVVAFTAEQWEDHTWIAGVFQRRDDADRFCEEQQATVQPHQPIGEDLDNGDHGYFLHEPEEHELK